MKKHTDIQADLHIHTVSSGHAFSTVSEIVAEAQKKGLKTIAITDHGPAMPGGPHSYHFSNLRVIEPVQGSLRVLKGVESNIINSDGDLDLEAEVLNRLDIVLATFHPSCGYKDLGMEGNTATLVKAIERNKVHVIAHPGNRLFSLDYNAVAKAAKDRNVLIEFNNASYGLKTNRGPVDDLDFELALACKKYGNKVVLSSDAHIAGDIGTFNLAWDLVTKAGINENQILNLDNERLLEFIETKH